MKMLFSFIRVILFIIVSISAIIKIRTSKIIKKKSVTILTVILCMVLLSTSAAFPAENLFINFKSPESVFNYAKSGKIDEIIYGQDSCMAIYSKGNSIGGYYIIPKKEKGYKIPSYQTVKKISHKFDESGLFDVYNVNGTRDYYIFGTIHLTDDENEIYIFNGNDEKEECSIYRVNDTDFIYFFLYDYSDEYYLIVNGEKVLISK